MSIAFFDNLYFSVSFILLLIIKIYIDILLFTKAAKKNKAFHYPKIYKFITNILISNLCLLICFVLNLFSPINSNDEINKILCKIQSIGLKIFIPSSDLNLLIYVLLLYHEVFYSFDTDFINYHLYIFLPYFIFICLQIPEFIIKNFDNKTIFNGIYCFENKFKLFHSKISSTIFFIYFVKIICFLIIIIIIINIVINTRKQTDVYEYNIYLNYFIYKLSFIFTYVITSVLIFIFKIIVILKDYENEEKDDLYYWMIIVSYQLCGIIYSILFAWNSNLLSCRVKVTKIKSHTSSVSSHNNEVSSELSSII
jgi:hypothetical protein